MIKLKVRRSPNNIKEGVYDGDAVCVSASVSVSLVGDFLVINIIITEKESVC